MADPVPEFYESDQTTVVNAGNPIAFGNVGPAESAVPTDSAKTPIWIYNQKGGTTAETMTDVKLTFRNSVGGNTGELFEGTAGNSNVPMTEARSDGSVGAADDAQASFTPIGGTTQLSIGNLAAGQGRAIYLQVNLPGDVAAQVPPSGFFEINYTF